LRLIEKDIKETGAILAVVDPLFDVLDVTDINAYMDVNRAIKPLVAIARDTGCSIVALHHKNKAGRGDSARDILGSTQIRGATDCNMTLSQDDGVRYIRTEQRYACDRAIPRTKLVYDPATGRVALEDAESADEQKRLEMEERILSALADGQVLSTHKLHEAVGGNKQRFETVLTALDVTGDVVGEDGPRNAVLWHRPDRVEMPRRRGTLVDWNLVADWDPDRDGYKEGAPR
jgi:hypothetical protein